MLSFFLMAFCFSFSAGAAEISLVDRESFWNRRGWTNPQELVAVIQSVPQGKELWEKSLQKEQGLPSELSSGKASYTESSFVRSYSLLDGKEIVRQKNKIYLNSSLSLAEAALDLAHELIHFNDKAVLNPYRDNFTVEAFISQGIEGKGGELDALEQECAISWALEQKFKYFPRHKICSKYRDQSGVFARDQALKDYYSIGGWDFPSEVEQHLPLLNRRPIHLSSSYAKKPYPLALYQDFLDTKKSACANNQKKYELISAQVEGGRNPAGFSALEKEKRRLKRYRERNCKKVESDDS